MSVVYFRQTRSPIGSLLLSATEKGLCSMEFEGASEQGLAALEQRLKRRIAPDVSLCEGGGLTEEAAGQLEEYFAGLRRSFDLPLDLQGTPFQLKVWRALTEISYGKACSYKQVAEAIGSPRAVRAVGGANNRNPVPVIIPCHRVIGAGGDLVGYGGGLPIKQFLLKHEGYLPMCN